MEADMGYSVLTEDKDDCIAIENAADTIYGRATTFDKLPRHLVSNLATLLMNIAGDLQEPGDAATLATIETLADAVQRDTKSYLAHQRLGEANRKAAEHGA